MLAQRKCKTSGKGVTMPCEELDKGLAPGICLTPLEVGLALANGVIRQQSGKQNSWEFPRWCGSRGSAGLNPTGPRGI